MILKVLHHCSRRDFLRFDDEHWNQRLVKSKMIPFGHKVSSHSSRFFLHHHTSILLKATAYESLVLKLIEVPQCLSVMR